MTAPEMLETRTTADSGADSESQLGVLLGPDDAHEPVAVPEPESSSSEPTPPATSRRRMVDRGRRRAPSPPAIRKPARPKKPPLPPGPERPLYVTSSIMTIIALMMGTFVATMAVIGPVRHERDQQTLFATLRANLANATAPVTQITEDGRLQPLGEPIAVLDIPQIGVREVVLEGTTSGVMMSGPGHRRDTPLPGQAGTSIVMGRQAAFGGPFRDLDTLKPGNVFTVTTGQGIHRYRITTVRREGQFMPPPLQAGKGRITLVTAAGRGWVPEGQLRVDADLVTAVQPAGPRPLSAAALPGAEKALGGDSSVWISIMLLCQAMLLLTVVVTWVRFRWGRWQTWLAGGPIVLALAVALTTQVAALLPNLM